MTESTLYMIWNHELIKIVFCWQLYPFLETVNLISENGKDHRSHTNRRRTV